MTVALRFIRRHSDTIGHHISFFLTIFSFDTKHVTGYHVPSSSLVHLDILFDDNTLSHKSVGSWKISLAIWIDPDAWMWLFDDEDASRDATKKARQIYLFSIYLSCDSSLITLFFSYKTTTTSSPLPHAHVASASSSVSPSSFAVPSRESTSKPTRGNRAHSDDKHSGKGSPRVVRS